MTTTIPSFTDAAGRTWQTRISLATLARIQDEAGLNLLAEVDRFLSEPAALFGTIVATIRPQLDRAHVTPEALGNAMTQAEVPGAILAVLRGLAGYMKHDNRSALLKIIDDMEHAIASPAAAE